MVRILTIKPMGAFAALLTISVWTHTLYAYGPHTALDCLGCHDPHYAKAQKIFKVKNSVLVNPRTGTKIDDVSALCLGCHTTVAFGGAGVRPIHLHMTHPLNIRPNPRIATVPAKLLRNNKLQCVSCHDPHPSNANWRYLRVDSQSGVHVGNFCQLCHPAKVDVSFYGTSRKDLKVFTSMNEEKGAVSMSPWDPRFVASNPTPVYIQPLGDFPNSVAPAYPTVAREPWIYNPSEERIPAALRMAIAGTPVPPNPDQLKQIEFNKRPYQDQTGLQADRPPSESPPPPTAPRPAAPEEKPAGFGLKKDSLKKLGTRQYLEVMYEGIRQDFIQNGFELKAVPNGFEGTGIALLKVMEDRGRGPEMVALRFSIDGNMSFETGSSKLTPPALRLIAMVGKAMEAYPETSARVGGHTDSTGSRALNEALSRARAQAVADELLRSHHLPPSRITEVRGFADRRKVVDTNGPEARNRRVEIVVTPVEIQKSIPAR